MALPIAPTPELKGKDAKRFLQKIEEGLKKHPTGPVPTPRLEEARRKALKKFSKLAAQKAFDTLSKPERTFSGGLITDPLPQRVKELEKRVEELERSKKTMNDAPQYYVSSLSVSSPQRLPAVCLDKLYTADDLDKVFKDVSRSYFANAIQFWCEEYSIIFEEL